MIIQVLELILCVILWTFFGAKLHAHVNKCTSICVSEVLFNSAMPILCFWAQLILAHLTQLCGHPLSATSLKLVNVNRKKNTFAGIITLKYIYPIVILLNQTILHKP